MSKRWYAVTVDWGSGKQPWLVAVEATTSVAARRSRSIKKLVKLGGRIVGRVVRLSNL